MKNEKKIYLSAIVPFFNEELNLPRLHKELLEALSKISQKSEIVYVNDASFDSSLENLKKTLQKKSPVPVKIVSLRRNFGQTAATSAGIDNAQGKILAFLDADLQNNPKDLMPALAKLKQGYDAVVGWRNKRNDSYLRTSVSKIANFFIRIIFNTPFHDLGCSLKVVRRDYIRDTRIYGESHRLISILLYWSGAKVYELKVDHRQRVSGRSKYGYSRILKLILDLITIKFLSAYGTKPAYVFGTFGILSIAVSILLMFVVLYHKFILDVFVHRNPLFIIASFLLMLGIQFLLMGLLAELIVRTYFESQKKPIYELKDVKDY